MGPALIQLGQVHPEQEPFHLQPVGYDKCCHVLTSSLLPFLPGKTGFSLPEEPRQCSFDTAAAAQHGQKVKTGLTETLAAAGLVKVKATTACLRPLWGRGWSSILCIPHQAWHEPGLSPQEIKSSKSPHFTSTASSPGRNTAPKKSRWGYESQYHTS